MSTSVVARDMRGCGGGGHTLPYKSVALTENLPNGKNNNWQSPT